MCDLNTIPKIMSHEWMEESGSLYAGKKRKRRGHGLKKPKAISDT